MDRLLIACADVGSVSNGNFGWADSDGFEGNKPSGLVSRVAAALAAGRPVALGFECPLFVPLPEAEDQLGKGRIGEGSRAWSAGAGCGALATGLVQATWTLAEIRKQCPPSCRAHLAWDGFEAAGCDLLVWEAFVSGANKGSGHIADARLAVEAFAARLPRPETEIQAINPMSLAGFALLRAGWPIEIDVLNLPCLVIKA
jgi:hypothetical protein